MTALPASWLSLVGLGIIIAGLGIVIAAELAYIAHETPQQATVTVVVPVPRLDPVDFKQLATFERSMPAEVCP